MAGIILRELYPRVTSRSDILPGAIRAALIDAAIQVCRDANLLRETVFETLAAGSSKLQVPTPPGREVTRVNQVFLRDPTWNSSDWVKLSDIAPVYMEEQSLHAESHVAQQPSAWGLRGDILFFPDPADQAYPLRIQYSWAPLRSTQPEIFDISSGAEEAIIAYARFILLQDRDPRMALASRRDYDFALPGLRAASESGDSGSRSIFDFLPFER